MKIVIAESVKSYCASRGVRTAIDTLSEQSKGYLPDHLEWDELRSYYQSVLAAATIHTDFAIFYLDIWNAIWKPALEACSVTEPWTIDEMQEADNAPSLETLWYSGLYRTHYHPNDENTSIDTHVEIDVVKNQLVIYISLASWNAEGNPKEIALPAEWEQSESEFDGWYKTKKDAFPAIDPNATTEIDCTRMQKTAEEALRQIIGS
ncbi:hypothetical protein [Thiococcus pfennigii]|uniref:hypothetical protein n=1 Tax=Thiococcus pfennigii TaxID=1057 RepID=UPI0019065EA0|nr:hypothetical protein [Thiococcus pfennigii]MBK1700229.1 hypothetical protein [Thiococcus pfennigii]MBK1732705.1 hypothetical protein [Thiococcus pfennigii]